MVAIIDIDCVLTAYPEKFDEGYLFRGKDRNLKKQRDRNVIGHRRRPISEVNEEGSEGEGNQGEDENGQDKDLEDGSEERVCGKTYWEAVFGR